jgi:hypothetical protein
VKVISVLQPHAQLIVLGAKRIETRPRRTNYRGMIAIHASKGPIQMEGSPRAATAMLQALIDGGFDALDTLPRGCIIGTARIVDCIPSWKLCLDRKDLLTDREYLFGDYGPNRFGYVVEDVRRLKHPIPAKGQLGLWEVDDALLRDADHVEVAQP